MYVAKHWIRLVVPLVIFGALFVLVQFALGQWTQSTSILNPDAITKMTAQIAAQSPSTEFVDQGAETANPMAAWVASNQRNILNGLNGWAFRVFLFGLVLSLGWSIFALLRQARTFGPRGQKGAWPAWILFVLLYVGLIVGFFFLFLDKLGLGEVMSAPKYIGVTVLIALLGLAAYWLATALAASPVMKPSVPLGTRLP